MGNFVRGLILSVSGFLGMWFCMSYTSSAYSPYLVPLGLASVFLGTVGFVVMVSGMNRAINSSDSDQGRSSSDSTLNLVERPRISEGMELGRLEDPTSKI